VASDTTFLLLQAGTGNVHAFDDFVRETQHDLQRFVRSFVGPDEAADVAQEAFIRAWRSAPSFTGSSNGKTWLFGVARNVVADHQRRHARRNRIRRFVSLTSNGDYDRENLSARVSSGFSRGEVGGPATQQSFEEYAALSELVDRLEPARREAFVLTQIVGFSYAEAAEVCGVPVGTIRSRVARAREFLAAAYQHGDGNLDSEINAGLNAQAPSAEAI
jgi:RNA polymerase sigma-70 factor, ECF subfamily